MYPLPASKELEVASQSVCFLCLDVWPTQCPPVVLGRVAGSSNSDCTHLMEQQCCFLDHPESIEQNVLHRQNVVKMLEGRIADQELGSLGYRKFLSFHLQNEVGFLTSYLLGLENKVK